MRELPMTKLKVACMCLLSFKHFICKQNESILDFISKSLHSHMFCSIFFFMGHPMVIKLTSFHVWAQVDLLESELN